MKNRLNCHSLCWRLTKMVKCEILFTFDSRHSVEKFPTSIFWYYVISLFLYITIVGKIGYVIFIVRLTFHQCICNNTAIMQSDKIHCHFGTFYDKKGIFFRLQRRTCLSIHFLGHYVNQWYISSWQKHDFLVKYARNG